MMKKILLIVVMYSLVSYQAVFACSGAGDNKHIGMVISIDEQTKTFTIMDMELRKPITFSAVADILGKVANATSTIAVTYEEKDGQLIAIEIES